MTKKLYPVLSIAAAGLLMASACGKPKVPQVANEEEKSPAPAAAPLLSAVRMGDATASKQLLKGFYAPEDGSWRWTAGSFSIALRPPDGAAQRGATLTFAVSVPEAVVQKTGPVTLTASIGDKVLNTATWSKSGTYTFTADVPPDLLQSDSVRIDFKTDKNLPPSPTGDRRELALIATSIGLAPK